MGGGWAEALNLEFRLFSIVLGPGQAQLLPELSGQLYGTMLLANLSTLE